MMENKFLYNNHEKSPPQMNSEREKKRNLLFENENRFERHRLIAHID